MPQTPKFTLYHYWRSSCSWRVRWALAHKKIEYHPIVVGLLNGESESEEHLHRNPAGFVPVLEIESGVRLTESLAIISYLDERFPLPPLFPENSVDRARVRAMAETINSGTQPLQNIPVMAYLSSDSEAQKKWSQHWIKTGLNTYEKLCTESAGKFSFGDELSLADLCLIPQVYNAERFSVPIEPFPTISRIYRNCLALDSLKKSHPDVFKPQES